MSRFTAFILVLINLVVIHDLPGSEPNSLARHLRSLKNQRSVSELPGFDLLQPVYSAILKQRSQSIVKHAEYYDINDRDHSLLRRLAPELISVPVKYQEESLTLELYRQSPFSEDVVVRTPSGIEDVNHGLYYRGIIKGDEESLVSLSIFNDQLIGIISSDELGNLVLGKWEGADDKHILYQDKEMQIIQPFECVAIEAPQGDEIRHPEDKNNQRSSIENCINVYFEADYHLFKNKGSVTSVANFLGGVFNGVASLYALEEIMVKISEIFVWTEQDPFSTSSSSTALNDFAITRPSFNGNIGHLVSLNPNNLGGIAYLGVLCSGSHNYAYSNIASSFSNFPTYSWTVNVVAHEMGHNIGSPHTHDCKWGPGKNEALDNCYPSSGGCMPGPSPVGGGTIMSYCHRNSVGINFNNGFGNEPGDLLRSRASSAPCLAACSGGGISGGGSTGGGGGSGGGGGGDGGDGGGGNTCTLDIAGVLVTDATCSENNGRIVINVDGKGPESIRYNIGTGPTGNNTFTNLAPGKYDITVTAGTACSQNASATVVMASEKPEFEISTTDALCGNDIGEISINAKKGKPPFMYYVGSEFSSNNKFINLAPGNYPVKIKDSDQCESDPKSIVIADVQGPTLQSDVTHTSCGENNGIIKIKGVGGVGRFELRLGSRTRSTGVFNSLEPGIYQAKVTDQNGCFDEQVIKINGSQAISAAAEIIHSECGENNGTITISTQGGTGNINYKVGSAAQSEPVFSDLSAGIYPVQVTDEAGCSYTFSTEVQSSESFEVSFDIVHTSCEQDNGTIEVSVAGTSGPFQYKLGNLDFQDGYRFTNLSSGQYQLTVLDNKGCEQMEKIEIRPSSLPDVEITVDHTSCGDQNGALSVKAFEGISPYQFSLGDEYTPQSEFHDLPAGTYTIKVKDAHDCIAIEEINIDDSEPVDALPDIRHTTCGLPNGVLSISAISGVSPFQYSLGESYQTSKIFEDLAPGEYFLEVIDDDNCIYSDTLWIAPSDTLQFNAHIEPTSCGLDNGILEISSYGNTGRIMVDLGEGFTEEHDFRDLKPGVYFVSIQDSIGCKAGFETEIKGSTNPEVSLSKTDTRCGEQNGALEIEINSGVGPYTIFVNGSPADEMNLEQLISGNYMVRVKDFNDCVDTDSIQIQASTSPVLSVQTVPTFCMKQNGVIIAQGEFGIQPYYFSIGDHFSIDTLYPNLPQGSYIVSLEDSDQCQDSLIVQIVDDQRYKRPELPDEMHICLGDQLLIDPGDISNAAIFWHYYGQVIEGSSAVLATYQPGDYTVYAEYSEDCVLSDSVTVDLFDKPLVEVDSAVSLCSGELFSVRSGSDQYDYIWSNSQMGNEVRFDESGLYLLNAVSHQGCTSTYQIRAEVIQPVSLSVEQAHFTICPGESITLSVDGAELYLWSTDDLTINSKTISSPVISPARGGIYTVTGYNRCFSDTLSISVDIAENTIPVTPDTTVIEGTPLTLVVENGSTAAWVTDDFQLSCYECPSTELVPGSNGRVSVFYNDGFGCSWSESIEIKVTPLDDIIPFLPNVITPNADGRNDELTFNRLENFRAWNLSIFDQLGYKVFDSDQYNNEWNGTFNGRQLPEGVYFYILTLELDGRTFKMDSDLTIIRN